MSALMWRLLVVASLAALLGPMVYEYAAFVQLTLEHIP